VYKINIQKKLIIKLYKIMKVAPNYLTHKMQIDSNNLFAFL